MVRYDVASNICLARCPHQTGYELVASKICQVLPSPWLCRLSPIFRLSARTNLRSRELRPAAAAAAPAAAPVAAPAAAAAPGGSTSSLSSLARNCASCPETGPSLIRCFSSTESIFEVFRYDTKVSEDNFVVSGTECQV